MVEHNIGLLQFIEDLVLKSQEVFNDPKQFSTFYNLLRQRFAALLSKELEFSHLLPLFFVTVHHNHASFPIADLFLVDYFVELVLAAPHHLAEFFAFEFYFFVGSEQHTLYEVWK